MPSQNGEKTPTAIASIYGSADRFTTANGITTAWFGNLPLEVVEACARSLQSKETRLVEAALIDGKWTCTRVTSLPTTPSRTPASQPLTAPAPAASTVTALPARATSPSRISPFPSRSSSSSGGGVRPGGAHPNRQASAPPPPAAGAATRRSMISRAPAAESQPQPPMSRPPFNPAADDEMLDIPF